MRNPLPGLPPGGKEKEFGNFRKRKNKNVLHDDIN